jgi:PAS domain S-box-containing protein
MTRLFSLFNSRHFGITLLIAVAAGLISMCGQVIWLYAQSQNSAQDQLQDAAKMMRAPATQALFELNQEMAHSVVSSLILESVGHINEATILDARRQAFNNAKTPAKTIQSNLFPNLSKFEIPLETQGNRLGFLVVTPDRQLVINQFWTAAGELAVIEFIRSFLVAFALALLLQFRIERPFQRLSRQILAADASNPDHTLKLLKQSQISEQVGELGSSIEQFLIIAQQQLIEKNQALGRVEELERLQQVIRESEARYRSLISALSEGVVQQNQAGEIVTFNDAALHILGLNAEQLQGRTSLDANWRCIHEDGSDYPGNTHPAMITLATGKPIMANIMGVHAHNQLRWISINTQALFSQNDNHPSSVVSTFSDITTTRQTQIALQHAKENAERYLQTAGVVMLVLDSNYCIELANARAAQIIGLPVEQLIGMNYVEHFTKPADQQRLRNYLGRIFSGRAPSNTDVEGVLLTHHGIERSMAWHNVCVLDAQQQVQSLLCSGEDVTESLQLQTSLQLRSNLLEQLSKEQSFNDFITWLCATLHEHIPSVAAAILIPHNVPPILGAHHVAAQAMWQDYLDAIEFGTASWPKSSMSLANSVDDASQFATADNLDLHHILLEPIHQQPRALLGLIFDPYSPPSAHELETVEVFTHIARLALERHTGDEQLQKTTSQAIAASRAKSDFLANMSHEIRTPLNAVLGFSGLMQQTVLNHEQKEFIDAIHTSGNALLSLINDLLDYSKIEAGHLELEKIEFDLRRLVDDVLDIIAEKVEQKGLMVYTQIDTAFPEKVIGDPGRFRQVLLNLINNASKFTASGHITLRIALLSHQGETLRLRCEVIDTGIGIDFASSSKLFQPFIQADSSTTRQFGGTGLGLSICRRLVEAMEGEIGVESQVGFGSTFWFCATLYCKSPALTQLPEQIVGVSILAITDRSLAATTLQLSFDKNIQCIDLNVNEIKLPNEIHSLCILDILDSEQSQLIGLQIKQNYPNCPVIQMVALQDLKLVRDQFKNNETQIFIPRPLRRKLLINAAEQLLAPDSLTPVERRSTPRIQQNLAVLLVEDNPINQRVATLILQKLGCIVTVAGNGLECLSILEQQEFALILMDCQMPVMDGFTATRAVRALQNEKAKMPIVALTSNAFQEDRDACLDAGMNDFVTKPVTALALNEIINRWAKTPN